MSEIIAKCKEQMEAAENISNEAVEAIEGPVIKIF